MLVKGLKDERLVNPECLKSTMLVESHSKTNNTDAFKQRPPNTCTNYPNKDRRRQE